MERSCAGSYSKITINKVCSDPVIIKTDINYNYYVDFIITRLLQLNCICLLTSVQQVIKSCFPNNLVSSIPVHGCRKNTIQKFLICIEHLMLHDIGSTTAILVYMKIGNSPERGLILKINAPDPSSKT